MIIQHVTTVNWGQLPIGDVRLAEVVLLAGETGAGKSSFIDAVIGVMTGNELRFAKYNSAQSEATSSRKTKRTVASYVLGADDSAEPHRQHGAHGYAGIYFEPDKRDDGAGQPFTAIVGAEARLERLANQPVFKSLEDVRIIVFGNKVGAADLVTMVDGTEEVIPVQELLVTLRKKFGKDSVRDYSTKTEYVCRLYAALKGQPSPVDRREAEGCMRAFVNSIAYRQPDDIDALIREDILEPDDNARMIETLKTTITDVSNLRQQAERMENNVRLLEEAEGFLNEGAKHFIEEWMFAALEAAKLLQDAVARRDQSLEAKAKATATLGDINEEILKCDAQAAVENEAWERLRARINDSDVNRVRQVIQDRIERSGDAIRSFEQRLRSATLTLSAARNVIRQSVAACSGVDDLGDAAMRLSAIGQKIDDIRLPEIEGFFRAVKDGFDGGAAVRLQEAIVAIDTAIGSGWTAEIDSIAEPFHFAHDRLRQDLDLLRAKRSDSETKRKALASGRTSYPRGVPEFVAHLAQILPEAKPRILCDVVEMKDPSWQNAVEGFIGGDRFAILYEPDYEARVIALLRSYRDAGGDRPSVAQIGRALRDAGTPAPDSLVGKIKTSDRVALGYLTARYGRSVCVATEEALKDVRSGLMQDGVSVAGYNYRNRSEPDDRLVFGLEVRRRQAESLVAAIEQMNKEIAERSTREQNVRNAITLMGRAKQAELDDLDVGSFQAAGKELNAAKLELESLDVSSIADLERQAADAKAKVTKLTERKNELLPIVGELNRDIRIADVKANDETVQIGKLTPDAERAEKNWRIALSSVLQKQLPFESLYHQEIESGRPVKSFHDRNVERRSWAQDAKNGAENVLREYNRDALEYQKIAVHTLQYPLPSPELMTEWLRSQFEQVADQIRRQRDTGLVEQREKLVMAEVQFTKSFTSNFCLRILQRVTGPDRTIDVINKSLEDISFSGDKILMTQSLREEYSQYLDLFRAVRERTEVGPADLFSGAEYAPAEKATLEALRLLLLSNDVEHSMRELNRIADYRNYKKYDFEKSSKGGDPRGLSTWGTGSGGEAETPFYIIRAAVFAASFRLFSKQKISHFRTLFLDEVFKNMDETRTRRVIDFLTKEMGFQLVCAAPTKSMAALMDVFNRRISFSKTPAAGSPTWIDEVDLEQQQIAEIYEKHRRNTVADAQTKFELANPFKTDIGEAAE
ncbi:SbcC/MukB-like Walker B domain-containing protein [Bradyrhizobium sp. UFLA01-814]|uniref:SbcC/MukB-like Walker B domain-containing protein n=1 Tax=Bradyrhizobium sp. UFLA01-814 TaxID=3023480 RepID=UPI00398ADFA7